MEFPVQTSPCAVFEPCPILGGLLRARARPASDAVARRAPVLARCLPERLVRDAKVFVDRDVPHGAHLRPWQVGIGPDHVIWNVARSLANDAEAEADGIHGLFVREERRELHARRIPLHALHRRQDVLDAEAPVPSCGVSVGCSSCGLPQAANRRR